MSSRDINDLHPKVAKLCRAFIEKCKVENIDVIITSTYRTMDEQAALWAQGRTKPGAKVTSARPGQSYHQYRCAFDFVPIENGKCQWNDTQAFIKCGKIAESLGLEWAGRWNGKMHEMVHCQYTGGLTLADLQNGKKIS